MANRPERFDRADLFQQLTGALLIAGGLLIPGDVWEIAAGMSLRRAVAAVAIALALTYLALYTAVERRDPSAERTVAGLPLRFLSTVAIAVGVSLLIVLLYGLPLEGERSAVETTKAVLVATFFTVLVAAVADVAAG
ncbi:hypothetical protein [Halobaculum magnesiiphilum]|uniref:DUF2391 domain-containing protein n=1 Tax=Halobaculum magnesiiphilum TaxID=1017351 RepID=A0A8T8WEY0_9EURY|nr:hypothetical protein [Halobaculum magnesiiphilum]QZP38405.1 hypothetical protein K6T50_04490 [Halobaculum magnesiiphilum]